MKTYFFTLPGKKVQPVKASNLNLAQYKMQYLYSWGWLEVYTEEQWLEKELQKEIKQKFDTVYVY